MVASELIKGKNIEESDALPFLTKGLKSQTLLDILNGSIISAKVFNGLFDVFTSVQAPGSGASDLAVAIIGNEMGRLYVFKWAVHFPDRPKAGCPQMGRPVSTFLRLMTNLRDLPCNALSLAVGVAYLESACLAWVP